MGSYDFERCSFTFVGMASLTSIDQMGNKINVLFPPQRIVSLVPSQTELLATLGLDKEVVGITKFCVHPVGWRKSKTSIGGTKKFNIDSIHTLKPDLVIGNKEENYPEGIKMLQSYYPVWMSDITTPEEALTIIQSLGEITNTVSAAENLALKIKVAFSEIQSLNRLRALYLIWKNPWMGVAKETFIDSMLARAGFVNCLHSFTRYPELTEQEIQELNPRVVLLSSEPFPFGEKHILELKRILPDARVVLVDGEMFSWYGSRMLHFPDYLQKLKIQLA